MKPVERICQKCAIYAELKSEVLCSLKFAQRLIYFHLLLSNLFSAILTEKVLSQVQRQGWDLQGVYCLTLRDEVRSCETPTAPNVNS